VTKGYADAPAFTSIAPAFTSYITYSRTKQFISRFKGKKCLVN